MPSNGHYHEDFIEEVVQDIEVGVQLVQRHRQRHRPQQLNVLGCAHAMRRSTTHVSEQQQNTHVKAEHTEHGHSPRKERLSSIQPIIAGRSEYSLMSMPCRQAIDNQRIKTHKSLDRKAFENSANTNTHNEHTSTRGLSSMPMMKFQNGDSGWWPFACGKCQQHE